MTAPIQDENSVSVDVTQLSDEELDKALVADPDTSALETPQSKAQTPEATSEETPLSIEEQLKAAQEKLDKFEQRLRDKDSYIGTRNHKIKELETQIQKSREELNGETLTVDNYGKFSAMIKAEEELKTERESLTEHENKQRISEMVPDLDALKEYMIQVGRELGDSEDTINAFKENPYRFDPLAVARIAREARLKKQLDDLSKGKQLADTLNSRVIAAAQTKTLTNSVGGATPPQRELSDAELRNMTDAELDALLK